MTLGNTNGNNRGKKYLKLNGTEVATICNQYKYNLFSVWFSQNSHKIKNQIISKTSFNNDVFNDTFLKVSNKILYGGLDIKNYTSYFSRAYFTNYISHHDYVKLIPLELVSNEVPDHNDTQHSLSEFTEDVMAYVLKRYNKTQYDIFYTYFTQIEEKTTFRKLASLHNISTFTVHYTINMIIKDSLLLGVLAYNVGEYKLINQDGSPRSDLLKKLKTGNRDIYSEYVSYRKAWGRIIPSIEKRRIKEFQTLYIK